MSANAAPVWTDPATCPYCTATLDDPGAGFIDHIRSNPDCESWFETWRDNVAGDVTGEWAG